MLLLKSRQRQYCRHHVFHVTSTPIWMLLQGGHLVSTRVTVCKMTSYRSCADVHVLIRVRECTKSAPYQTIKLDFDGWAYLTLDRDRYLYDRLPCRFGTFSYSVTRPVYISTAPVTSHDPGRKRLHALILGDPLVVASILVC